MYQQDDDEDEKKDTEEKDKVSSHFIATYINTTVLLYDPKKLFAAHNAMMPLSASSKDTFSFRTIT